MRVLQAYKSRKYLLRIMLSITFFMVIILSLSSAVLHYSSEQRVIHIQQEANKKVMNQINHNITFMQEVVKDLALRLYGGKEIVPLMSDIAVDPLDRISAIRQLNDVQDSYEFLHSILIYNGHFQEIHAFGGLSAEKPEHSLAVQMAKMLKEEKKQPQMRLLPMNFSQREHSVDFFSLLMYETYRESSQNDSILVLNIKPEWIFDNLKAVNDFAAPDQSSLFMTDHTGQMMIFGNKSDIPALEHLKQELLKHQQEQASDFGFFTSVFDGTGKYMISYMNMGEGDLKVVSVQPYKAVLGDIVKMRTTSISVILCFLILSVFVSVVMAHKLYKPVETMLRRIKTHFESGAETPVGQDELEFVSDVHNDLVHKLYMATDERDKQKKIVRNYYLRSIVTNSLSFSGIEFTECVEHNGLGIVPAGPFLLVIAKVDHLTELMNQTSHNQRMLYFFAVSNIAEEIFAQSEFQCEIVDMKGDHLVMILSQAGVVDLEQEKIHVSLRRIQDIVQEYYKLSISMTLSTKMTSHLDITAQYSLALQYSMYKLLFGKKAIITPEKVKSNHEQAEYHLPPELNKKLIEAIRTNDLAMMENSLTQILNHLSGFHYDHIIHGVLHLVDVIKSTIREMNSLRISAVPIDLSVMSRQILEKETYEEMRVLFHQTCQEIHDKLKNTEQDKHAALVEAVKEIIVSNYDDINLSLQSIAATLKMTSAYVGRIFKQCELISVGEYMNEIRLNQAREFLETKNLSIKEIMELVGFLNESTFFKLFKKKYGVTPKEYRLKRSMA